MKPGAQRALVGVLSIAAVLFPAAGIAYFGAVSYQEDRGIVAAQLDARFRAAQTVAAAVERELETTLTQAAETLRAPRPSPEALATLRERHPLAAQPFRIGRDGKLSFPAAEPLRAEAEPDFLDRAPRTCPERGFDTCVRAIWATRARARQLEAARRRELGACAAASATCQTDARAAEAARRAYLALTRFDDTGPDALLGLARLARSRDDLRGALQHYRALGERFGTRLDRDRIAYALLADLGTATVSQDPAVALDIYGKLVGRAYWAPSATLARAADMLRERLATAALTAEQQHQREDMDRKLRAAHAEAAFAASLADESDEIAHTASEHMRGRQALTDPQRTLVHRRLPTGAVIGIVVDLSMLEQAAAAAELDLAALAPGTRAIVERLGDAGARKAGARTLATAGFGPVLPHLTLALINDRRMPDPLDEIIEARGQRHLAITGGLVAVLLIGLIATIRGAARERELARLKSDFVSTVSHELKTPLTSIRMFGEMLQQGVAGSDREREARYHEIIVKESERLGLLIANLLDYAQIERGTRRYSRKPEPAAEIVRAAVAAFLRVREQDRHPVRVEVCDADAEILVDREVVVQCVLNLLANAAKYGGTGKPIHVVVAAAPGDDVILSVRDQGPGIPAAEQRRIFREFYRAPAAYSSGVEGTGLGLALVKRHVEALGGTVTVDSQEGHGATFSIRFPRC